MVIPMGIVPPFSVMKSRGLPAVYRLLMALTSARTPATMMSVWVPQPQVSLPSGHFSPT